MSVAEGPPKRNPRPRGRRPKAKPDGRRALLDAAITAFARHGYDGADLRGIAQVADVDPGLIRVHFGAKAGLWEACVDAVATECAPILAETRRLSRLHDGPVAQRLRRYIENLAAFIVAHPHIRTFVTQHPSESLSRIAILTERLVRPAYEAARPLIQAGIDGGYVRIRHPALFFGLIHDAVNRPAFASVLLHELAPDIDVDDINQLLVESLIVSFLDLSADTNAVPVVAAPPWTAPASDGETG